MTIALDGVGNFGPRGRAHNLWARVQPSLALSALHRNGNGALRRCGIASEPRTLTPHITIARLPRTARSIDHWRAEAADFSVPPFVIDGFGLYESQLGSGGSSYHLAAHFPLN